MVILHFGGTALSLSLSLSLSCVCIGMDGTNAPFSCFFYLLLSVAGVVLLPKFRKWKRSITSPPIGRDNLRVVCVFFAICPLSQQRILIGKQRIELSVFFSLFASKGCPQSIDTKLHLHNVNHVASVGC